MSLPGVFARTEKDVGDACWAAKSANLHSGRRESVTAEERVGTPVAIVWSSGRAVDDDAGIVRVASRRATWLVAPKSFGMTTVPVVVNSRPDYQCDISEILSGTPVSG